MSIKMFIKMLDFIKKITNYPIRFSIPVLITITISISLVFAIIFFLNILKNITENQIQKQNQIYKFYITKNIQTENEFFDTLLLLHNSLDTKAFFIIHTQTNKILFSNETYYINKDIKFLQLTSYNFVYELLQSNSNNRYQTYLNLSENLIKKNENYIYIISKPELYWKFVFIYKFSILNFLLNQNLILTFSSFLIVLVFPFVLINLLYKYYFKKRIQNIIYFTEEIKKTNFQVRIPVQGKDEISYISSFLNHLAEIIEKLIFFDSLTEVLNRNGFEFNVNLILKKVQSGVFFFMDLDGFKYVNETFGHNIGNIALKIISKRICSLCEKNSFGGKIIFGRIGGDEFAIFFSTKIDYINYLNIQLFANKIIEVVSEKISINELDIILGISIGIAIYPKDGKSLGELLTNSDLAMHHSKNTIKNSFAFYDLFIKETYEQKNILRNALLTILKKNILKDHFYIVYQPIYSLKEEKITSTEVLLRFKHDSIKSEPSMFIPLLEELNLMKNIDNYVIEKSFADFDDLKKYSITKLSINLSISQLRSDDFYKNIKQLLSSFSIQPQNIIFEITETSFMKEPDKILKIINSLNDLGFSFALDDFGTGYSSLQYLKEIPIKNLKIDKTFIKDISYNKKSLNIIKALLKMSKSLNLEITAEGVEDFSTFTTLKNLEFDYVQGFFISPPLELGNFIKLIKKNNYQKL